MAITLNRPLYKTDTQRAWELDYFRGALVIVMIFGHFLYTLSAFAQAWRADVHFAIIRSEISRFWASGEIKVVRAIVVCGFFFIAGISSSFSKSNFLRGFKVLLFGVLTGYVAGFVGLKISFGVLHSLGLTMMIYGLMRSLSKFMPGFIILGFAIIAAGVIIKAEGVYDIALRKVYGGLPDGIGNSLDNVLHIMSIPMHPSSDYYPLIPWSGTFYIGAALGTLLYADRRSLIPALERPCFKVAEFFGRHAFAVYLTHQVVLYGLFTAYAYIKGLPLPF